MRQPPHQRQKFSTGKLRFGLPLLALLVAIQLAMHLWWVHDGTARFGPPLWQGLFAALVLTGVAVQCVDAGRTVLKSDRLTTRGWAGKQRIGRGDVTGVEVRRHWGERVVVVHTRSAAAPLTLAAPRGFGNRAFAAQAAAVAEWAGVPLLQADERGGDTTLLRQPPGQPGSPEL